MHEKKDIAVRIFKETKNYNFDVIDKKMNEGHRIISHQKTTEEAINKILLPKIFPNTKKKIDKLKTIESQFIQKEEETHLKIIEKEEKEWSDRFKKRFLQELNSIDFIESAHLFAEILEEYNEINILTHSFIMNHVLEETETKKINSQRFQKLIERLKKFEESSEYFDEEIEIITNKIHNGFSTSKEEVA